MMEEIVQLLPTKDGSSNASNLNPTPSSSIVPPIIVSFEVEPPITSPPLLYSREKHIDGIFL